METPRSKTDRNVNILHTKTADTSAAVQLAPLQMGNEGLDRSVTDLNLQEQRKWTSSGSIRTLL
jgi:hypothetical protein